MRWMVWLLVAFAAAVGLALLMRFNHGNVAVLWPPYRIEISVNLALALLLAVFGALHLLLVGTARALRLPQRVREYRARRQQDTAVAALRDSVLAFFEGRHARVERHALLAQASVATAAPAALLAARSAQRMQEQSRRDRWLQEAQGDVGASNALLMTQAELAVEDRRTQEAIEIVERMHARGARHIVSLRTALRAYEQAERWDDVLRTLRLVEKRDALHPAAVRRLRDKAYGELVARKGGDPVALRELWRSLRADERAQPELASQTAAALADAGADDDARRIVEQALDAGFAESLPAVYARVGGLALRDRLERLEGWRSRYGDEPALLLALGRLCTAEKLWGKAEDYLKLATRGQPTVAGLSALGELYETLGRGEEAGRVFREAVRLAV
ncbi:MAG: heme biosynthesis protein HemY [Burkholderiales bacterium]|nr:heme biosynthesis protein HemY [Burkholderiales bacterium]